MDMNNGKVKSIVSRVLTLVLAFVMVATAVLAGAGGFTEEAYAKAIGAKNQQACDACKAVKSGTAPKGRDYENGAYAGERYDYEKLADGGVYRGGNAESGLQNADRLDTDPTDFASVLPYGTVYLDINKINWWNSKGFKIDAPDSRFQWVAANGQSATDSEGNSANAYPLGVERG